MEWYPIEMIHMKYETFFSEKITGFGGSDVHQTGDLEVNPHQIRQHCFTEIEYEV